MTDSPDVPPANEPPATIDAPPPDQKGLYATGCLTVAGAVMCMSIILAPIGVLLISIAGFMFGTLMIRRKFIHRTEAPCPYCLVVVRFRGEGIKPCPDCCHPIAIAGGKLVKPGDVP